MQNAVLRCFLELTNRIEQIFQWQNINNNNYAYLFHIHITHDNCTSNILPYEDFHWIQGHHLCTCQKLSYTYLQTTTFWKGFVWIYSIKLALEVVGDSHMIGCNAWELLQEYITLWRFQLNSRTPCVHLSTNIPHLLPSHHILTRVWLNLQYKTDIESDRNVIF